LPARVTSPEVAQEIDPESPEATFPVTLMMISTEPENVEDTVVEPETEVKPPPRLTILVKPVPAAPKAA